MDRTLVMREKNGKSLQLGIQVTEDCPGQLGGAGQWAEERNSFQ